MSQDVTNKSRQSSHFKLCQCFACVIIIQMMSSPSQMWLPKHLEELHIHDILLYHLEYDCNCTPHFVVNIEYCTGQTHLSYTDVDHFWTLYSLYFFFLLFCTCSPVLTFSLFFFFTLSIYFPSMLIIQDSKAFCCTCVHLFCCMRVTSESSKICNSDGLLISTLLEAGALTGSPRWCLFK